jgi:hypothetical protein
VEVVDAKLNVHCGRQEGGSIEKEASVSSKFRFARAFSQPLRSFLCPNVVKFHASRPSYAHYRWISQRSEDGSWAHMRVPAQSSEATILSIPSQKPVVSGTAEAKLGQLGEL